MKEQVYQNMRTGEALSCNSLDKKQITANHKVAMEWYNEGDNVKVCYLEDGKETTSMMWEN